MTAPGPKELANRANGAETRAKRKLIPFAGKERSAPGTPAFDYQKPAAPRQRKKRKRRTELKQETRP